MSEELELLQYGLKPVYITIEFLRIGEIDMMKEQYSADIAIESEWIEEDIINNYNPALNWNPKLKIDNCILKTEEKIDYKTRKEKFGDNFRTIISETWFLKGSFWERLELHNFPVDVQELSITLVSSLNEQVKLIANPQKLSIVNRNAKNTFVDQQKCEKASYDSHSTSSLNELNSMFEIIQNRKIYTKIPKLTASCFCSRKPGFYFFNAYFLIFLITISSLTIFSVNCKLPQSRLQITYIILLASVSFKWVINRSLPPVSYLTSLDKYAIICIFYICCLSLWHAIVGSQWSVDLAQFYDLWSLVIFSIIFLIIHLCFALWLFYAYKKIRELKKIELNFKKKDKEILYNF